MKLVFVQGCQRSGNHLFTVWIASFCCGKTTTARNICCNYEEQFDNNDLKNIRSPSIDESKRFILQTLLDCPKTECGIISYEHPGLIKEPQWNALLEDIGHTTKASSLKKYHLLRDPFNWMASYAKLRAGFKKKGVHTQLSAKKHEVYSNYRHHYSTYWKRWQRSYELWTSQPREEQIHYNRFILDQSYRKSIIEKASLKWNEATDQFIMNKTIGVGSSFSNKEPLTVSALLSRYQYIIPMLQTFGIPPFIKEAAQKHFPVVYQDIIAEVLKS